MDSSGSGSSRSVIVVAALLSALAPVALGAGNGQWRGRIVRTASQRAAAAGGQLSHGFVPADRNTLLLLGRARELMQLNRYAEAVRCLGTILESPEDFFFQPDPSSPVHRSLKSEAQRLLGQMPPQGRELYELEYGAAARKMLEEAATAGDPDRLAEVARRFFHTAAGYEATLLLGMHQLDGGSPLAGALTLKRLRDAGPAADAFEPALSLTLAACWAKAGMENEATETLAALKRQTPQAEVAVGGRETRVFTGEGESVAWLADSAASRADAAARQMINWVMLRGNPARNAATSSSGPLLTVRWKVPTTDYPAVESVIDRLRQEQQEQDAWLLPGLHPLVVDDLVLMRTATNLLAVDFKTGKRVWEVSPAEDPFEGLIDPPAEMQFRVQSQLETALRQRLWGDAVFGTLSSDGHYVFSVEDLDLGLASSYQNVVVLNGRASTSRQPSNRLAAFDIHSGKLMWEVGGPADQFRLPMAGAFFLGPPLPLMGNLYVVAEAKDEIRLLVLDAKTGNLLWSQQLSVVERNIAGDPLRRMAGVAPSYADGVLVCPTSNKSVVALDLATRSLLWAYTYESGFDPFQQQLMSMGVRHIDADGSEGRWADASVILAGGRVVATPIESDELHCLDLATGDLAWKKKRDNDLYVACVHQGNVVLVGRNCVRALRLDDGAPAWEGRTVKYPGGGVPSGEGFANQDAYFVPLSNSQVMAVDLTSGGIRGVYKSRQQNVPGNLVCYKDKIISERADAVEAFHQLDALRRESDQRLAARPGDPDALAHRGEIFWSEGNLGKAIDSFRRSLGAMAAGDPAAVLARQLLREALFEGLRAAFTTYRSDIDEVQTLIETPSDQATLWRLMTVGCETAGDHQAAFQYIQKLCALDLGLPGIDALDDGRSVRRDRWIQVRLASLYTSAPPEVRAAIDRWVEDQLQTLSEAGRPETLERFLGYCRAHPLASRIATEVARRWQAEGNLLRAELVLRGTQQSGNASQAARATARRADLLRQAGLTDDAAVEYARLQGEFAEVPGAEGKTGRDLVEALPADDPVRHRLRGPSAWPAGEVLVRRETPQGTARMTYGVSTIEYLGSQAPFFSDKTIEMRQSPLELAARDGWGNEQWRLPLDEMAQRDSFSMIRGLMRVEPCDHLLLVAMGRRLLAVDTLGRPGDRSPRVLWKQELNEPDLDTLRREQFRNQLAAMPGAFGVVQLVRLSTTPANMPSAVSERLVCLKRFHSCIAVEPATGETLWVRDGVRPDSTVFGDRQFVFILPPGDTTATVVRAEDGETLGQRQVPLERLATVGRRVLVLHSDGRKSSLEMFDPWDRRTLWSSRPLDQATRFGLVGEETVAAFEPDGRFLLLNLADGRALVDQSLEPEPSLAEIFVLPSPEAYVLITHRLDREDATLRRIYPIHGLTSARIGRGRVYAFGRDGKKLWPAPVSVKNQYLPLDQPSRLPVLTFACMVQQQNANLPLQPKTTILCLDKRTGRVILNEESSGPTNSFRLIGDPERKTVEVQLQRSTIALTFTDKPIAAATPKSSQPSSAVDGLWKALRNTVLGTDVDAESDLEDGDQPAESPADAVQPAKPQKPDGQTSSSIPDPFALPPEKTAPSVRDATTQASPPAAGKKLLPAMKIEAPRDRSFHRGRRVGTP